MTPILESCVVFDAGLCDAHNTLVVFLPTHDTEVSKCLMNLRAQNSLFTHGQATIQHRRPSYSPLGYKRRVYKSPERLMYRV